jgi:hypothetical protein
VNQLLTIEEGIPIGIHQNGIEIPEGFRLYQNYPNPFNPVTKIDFDIPANSGNENTRVSVFDVRGKLVSEILNRRFKPGKYSIDWKAANLPSGVYFYVLENGSLRVSGKMILLK